MLVSFVGRVRHKAFHDVGTKTIDLWSAEAESEGNAVSLGDALVLVCGDEGSFSHLSLDYSALATSEDLPPCPKETPVATFADLELNETDVMRVSFDPSLGTLLLAFGDRDTLEWARLGENLIWLALDKGGSLAGMMVRGISADAGGKAQNAWLAQAGIG